MVLNPFLRGLIGVPTKSTQPTTNRALVVTAFGHALILDWQGQQLEDTLHVVGTEADLAAELEPQQHEDGIWIWTGQLIDAGPESPEMPHIREHALDGEWRPATEAEWKAHLAGEWPWEPDPTTPDNK